MTIGKVIAGVVAEHMAREIDKSITSTPVAYYDPECPHPDSAFSFELSSHHPLALFDENQMNRMKADGRAENGVYNSQMFSLEAKLVDAQAEIKRLEERRCEICGYAEHHREHTGCLRTQLAAAQEEIAVLRKDAETYGPEKISLQKQAWLEADRQQQINDLKDQLTKAEQRVAEACALTYLEDYDLTDIADRVRAGEWRKFVKEV